MKYKIYAGLGGGFGGATYQESINFDNMDEALTHAEELAYEMYDDYAGMYGLRTIEEIIEEENCDEETAIEMYEEDKNNWIEFYVESFFYYKGFEGSFYEDDNNDKYFGKIQNIDEDIDYKADTIEELKTEFQEAVDNYIKCKIK
jgi:hypothetical protein